MGLTVVGASVRYGDVLAVDSADLSVAPGEIVALLGPSGSGKSSLLRAVAGLEPLASGAVLWDDADLSAVPVHARGFGMMFQDGQLFGHLSVAGNVGYGLFREPRAARRSRVQELLELVGLPGYGRRRITELSGGQAQRVALARSLAPRPRLLLLDEPLSALDRSLRERLVGVLGDVIRATGTTALYVTHDQDEAFALADRVGVMIGGRLLQTAAPDDLWRHPISREVAAFLGYAPFLTGEQSALVGGPDVGPEHLIGVGPAGVRLDPDGVAVPILQQTHRRGEVRVDVRLPDGQPAALTLPDRTEGAEVRITLDPAACVSVPR